MNFYYIYLFIINLITFFMFLSDKKKAQTKQWRIPESRLLFLALIGGSIGGILGMKIFRHKTKTLKFTIGIPMLLIINIFTFYFINKIS